MQPAVKIRSTGIAYPKRILTNNDLEKMVDTSDEWITTRTGIKQRRICDENTASSDLGTEAAKMALKEANLPAEEIDVIIVSTTIPDMLFPSTACFIQKNLKATKAAAFDILATCSGFIYGLACARGLIKSNNYKNVLLVSAEAMSKIVNWNDRNTCVLFGDGAGAALLSASEDNRDDILSIYIGADGNLSDLLMVPGGCGRNPATNQTIEKNMHYIHMKGREVFKIAVIKMIEALKKALEMCNLSCEDLKLLLPHQANIRIIKSMAEKLNFPMEKIYINIQKYGNVSSASNIIALHEVIKGGMVKKGDIIGLTAFGGGLTWGAAILKL